MYQIKSLRLYRNVFMSEHYIYIYILHYFFQCGRTALHYSYMLDIDGRNIRKYLLHAGADPNIKDNVSHY